MGFYYQLRSILVKGSETYFHTIIFSAGTYLAFPMGTLTCAPVVLRGVGILRTTLLAFSFPSKFARKCIVYSTRDFVGSVTCVCSLKGRLMLDVDRYLPISTASTKRTGTVCLPHELEFSIWGDEADGAVRIELPQSNTLMELAIVQFDRTL